MNIKRSRKTNNKKFINLSKLEFRNKSLFIKKNND